MANEQTARDLKPTIPIDRSRPIRVLIAEDSRAYRELLVNILQNAPDFEIVGAARDGAEAIRLARQLRPDVITMDIYMPKVDGYEATRRIMEDTPRPIVMVSGAFNKNEHKLTFDAIQAGALTVLGKPTLADPPEVQQHLISQIRLLSEVRVVRRWARSRVADNGTSIRSALQSGNALSSSGSRFQLITIAASTGGPGALAAILGPLPQDFPVSILVVQHVTAGFGQGLAAWLNEQTALDVRLAAQDDAPKPGEVLIAPDDSHMVISHNRRISLNKWPAYHGSRPAADHLFHSVAKTYGDTAIGIILTGMGSDGAQGLRAMREAGAYTIAQDEATCVVFGMPATAIRLGAAQQVKPLSAMAEALMALVQEQQV